MDTELRIGIGALMVIFIISVFWNARLESSCRARGGEVIERPGHLFSGCLGPSPR
jgi:hypothetical protein